MLKAGMRPFLAGVFFFSAFTVFSQNLIPAGAVWFSRSFEKGMEHYQEGRWFEAAAELRYAQETAQNLRQWSEALYWVILTELAVSDFGSALRDMEDLEKGAPESTRNTDMVYHRARAYFYLGYFEDALLLFKQYADNAGAGGESRKAAAIYWMGECLYAMGQLEQAEGFFHWIIEHHPASSKYEASVYRIDLIKQKKIEAELLALLKWSHEESLRTSEEFQRKEKNYEQAMNAYQRRIADLLKDSRVADLESANGDYQQQLAEARERIRLLEARLGAGGGSAPETDDLKVQAQRLRNEAQWDLRNLENGAENGGGGSR